ncbi:MAG: four-carbon acid sugar kinase family protein [Verrucomicrobia bacterium]|nr:four-carbon acid sugar kinase family protein [Verrucomicrobiota bacterium]
MKDYFLADDLSGALDAAGAFHHAGRRVRITLQDDAWEATEDAVVGVTTETRNATAAAAAARVARALARGQAQGARLLYKKIDSTLRGAVAAELAAVREALPGARVLFCPANPAVGRTVQGGRLLVHGRPVHETEFAHDPVCPVRESDLRRLLGSAGAGDVTFPDAANDADLAEAVRQQVAQGGAWVAVGSGALARPVASLGASRRTAPETTGAKPPPDGPILFCCGSAHPANREQAGTLSQARRVPVHTIALGDPDPAVAATIASLRETGGASVLVETNRHASDRVLQLLANTVPEILARSGAARLFVTGGETAYAICRALGVSTLDYEAELEPGMSLSRAQLPGSSLLLVNKPGGFGSALTWVRAWDALQGKSG